MSCLIHTAALFLAASFLLSFPALALQPLPTRHVHDVVVNGKAARLRPLETSKTLKLSIALPLRNEAELDKLIEDLYDPSSPKYHHWLTVEQFTSEFGPAESDYETVAKFAEANGMTVTVRSSNRLVIDLKSSVANVNKAFHVTMSEYRHPTEARTFYAPDREPSVELGVKLWHVAGLDSYSVPAAHLQYDVVHDVQHGVRASYAGSGPEGFYLGSDMRSIYYGGSALTGAGQAIGLYGLGYNLSDVASYFSSIGQPFNPNSVLNYSTDGDANTCGSGCDDSEPVIDIISSLSMAPGATIIEYFGYNDTDTFNAMASSNAAKQLSESLLWLPADPTSDEPIFKEFCAQGQNLFVASLDWGAYSNTEPSFYPADDPYITAVGGTDLATSSPGGPWASETAWIGSGGGPSYNSIAIPSYQKLSGVINSSNHGSTTLRNVPDVSAEANIDNYFCANGVCTVQSGYVIGGTSLAAPRWAGFLALVNEQAAASVKPSLGFLNPTLYSIGTSSSYGNEFHDITVGNNGDGSGNMFNAVSGYDLVTGWGSPRGQSTINALVGSPATPSTSCHVAYTINGEWSGSFQAGITIYNTGSSAINGWTLTWIFTNGQTISQFWSGNETQSGEKVTVSSPNYGGSIPAGGSYSGMGFNGVWNNLVNTVPTAFAVNGTVCH